MEWNVSPGYTLRVVYTFLFAEILPTVQMTPTYAHTYTHTTLQAAASMSFLPPAGLSNSSFQTRWTAEHMGLLTYWVQLLGVGWV